MASDSGALIGTMTSAKGAFDQLYSRALESFARASTLDPATPLEEAHEIFQTSIKAFNALWTLQQVQR